MHASPPKSAARGVQVSGPNSVARSARKLAKKRKVNVRIRQSTLHKMPDVKKKQAEMFPLSMFPHGAPLRSKPASLPQATACSFSDLLPSSSSTSADGDCELMRTHENSLAILHQELDNLVFPRRVRHLPTQTLRPHYRWRKHNRNVHARHQILALTLHNPL